MSRLKSENNDKKHWKSSVFHFFSHNKQDIKDNSGDNNKPKKEDFFRKLKSMFPLSKVSGKILLIYVLFVLAGGFLLCIPGVVTDKKHYWDFSSSVFNAASAFSDTGMSTLSASSSYSFWGQLLIILMIEIGGIGILTLKIVSFILLDRKISIYDQSVAQSERGSSILSNTVETIKDGFLFLTFVQIIGIIPLFCGFYFTKPHLFPDDSMTHYAYHDTVKALWDAVFNSISAVNNAGFDIVSLSYSIQSYNNGSFGGYLIQWVFLLQWVIGGLGYPTFHDIKKKILARRKNKVAKFSLFTKVNFVVYMILLVLGPLIVFGSESISGASSLILHPVDNYYSGYGKFMNIFFNVTASRNSGFSTININNFNDGSKWILIIWMFIGSAPSSTAGGIRTTTFAICFVSVWSIMRNRDSTDIFKKRIPELTVKRSFAVFFISILLVITCALIIFFDSSSAIQNTPNIKIRGSGLTFTNILILVCSAFGTVGFDPFGNLINFGLLSKLSLIIIMFLGQLGISNTLLAFIKPSNKQKFKYIEEEVVIG